MTVKVVVQFKARADSEDAFVAIMQAVSTDLPGVEGCQEVEVLQHQTDACRFTLVETWENQDIHRRHIDGLVADGTWATIAALLAEEPVSSYFKAL